MKHILFYTLLLPLLLVGCSADVGGNDIKRGHSTLQLVLQQTDPVATQSTRSARTSYNEDGDNIYNAYVVMYNMADNKVERIINVPTDAGEKEYKSKHVCTITTENGTYLFYSLANLPFVTTPATPNADTHEVTQLTTQGLTFEVGSPLPTGIDQTTYPCSFANDYTIPTTGIPMTNKEQFEVDRNRTITLSLYRLLAKMQFTFKNKSASIFRIRALKVGSLTLNDDATHGSHTSMLRFFPPKSNDGLIATDFTDLPHKVGTVAVYNPSSAVTLQPGTEETNAFLNRYINESVAETVGQSFPLQIVMERSNDHGATFNEDTRNGLIQLTNIPRNNVALVTVNLTDYVMKLRASAYAPIGGYPPYVLKQDDDFYATFTGGGDFALVPTLYEYADREHHEKWIDLNDKNKVQGYSLSVIDPASIFSKQPAFDNTTTEIIGTIASGRTGTATLRLTVQLITGPHSVQNYTRTIYVVSQ